MNVDALDEWCFPCLDGIIWTSKDVNETTGIGTGVGSFGYHCEGLSYQNNAWIFNLPVDTERNTDNCAGWYAYIDGNLAALAGIENENNNYTSVSKDISIKLPAVDKGVANFFSGLRASASGALTIKSTGDTLNRMITSFSMHPDEILPGKHNLWMNGGILFASLIESLVYASPNGVSSWLSTRNTNVDQGLMWTLIASTVASATLNVFPDFDEIYTRIPHDVKSVLYYSGVLKQKGSNHLRDEMLKILGKIASAAASGTPEFRAALVEMLGLKDKTIQRRRAIMA